MNNIVDIENTGLRQKPDKDGVEYPFHMTSVLRRLYPGYEWIMDKGVTAENGKCYHKPGNARSIYKPDFRNDELKIIVEIDGAGGKYLDHFSDPEKCETDIEKAELYKRLGYKAVFIPMYIQLDEEMVKYYFGIDYLEKLYPAADCHGFMHPDIALPASFCLAGIRRFKREMAEIPESVRNTVVDTLKRRIQQYIGDGYEPEDAKRKVILPSLDYLLE
jgi:hypothetical protein